MQAQILTDKEAQFLHEFIEASHEPAPSDLEGLRSAIAEAAYYRAEKRGFAPGYAVQDWVEAEQEIKARRA